MNLFMRVLNRCQGRSVDRTGSVSDSRNAREARSRRRSSLSHTAGTNLGVCTSARSVAVELPADPVQSRAQSRAQSRTPSMRSVNASQTFFRQPGFTTPPVGGSQPHSLMPGGHGSPSSSNISFHSAHSNRAQTPIHRDSHASTEGTSRDARSTSMTSFHSAQELPPNRLWGLDFLDPSELYPYQRR